MYHSFSPDQLAVGQLHATLLAGIAPRPIAFVSTVDAEGRHNLSPYSFFNIFGSNPPTLIFSPARRVRDNTTKHTLQNLREVGECVVNIVDYAMVEQMSLASTEYPKGVNEFVKAGLTQVQSERVAAMRVGESPLSMECVVEQIIETGQEGGSGNLVIARIVHVHQRQDCTGNNGLLDPDRLDLVGRMGGSYYVRASGEALFEIPKPLRDRGIGVDQLPASARDSHVLSGNDLGRLGNIAHLPSDSLLAEIEKDPRCQGISTAPAEVQIEQLHTYVKELLHQGKTEYALGVVIWGEANR